MKVYLKRPVGFMREFTLNHEGKVVKAPLVQAKVTGFLEKKLDGYDYIVEALDEFGCPHEFLVNRNEVRIIN